MPQNTRARVVASTLFSWPTMLKGLQRDRGASPRGTFERVRYREVYRPSTGAHRGGQAWARNGRVSKNLVPLKVRKGIEGGSLDQ